MRRPSMRRVRVAQRARRGTSRRLRGRAKRPSRTEGELAFEKYLRSVRLSFGFEEPVPGTTKRPDYRLTLAGQPARFEVKQFDPQPSDSFTGVRAFDPYPPVREKIEAARKKFKGLKGTGVPCSLVLFNNGKPLIFLNPLDVYAAMLGNIGITFPVDTRTGAGDMSQARQEFLHGGKMHRYSKDGRTAIAAQNTTISSIVVVGALSVGRIRFQIEVARAERELGRELSMEEHWDRLHEWDAREPGLGEAALRVIVCENPYAKTPLAAAFGRGPWDERFGPVKGHIERLFVGDELKRLEEDKVAAGIKVNPLR